MTESEPTRIRPAWRTIGAVVLALVVAGIALGQLQGLLQGMHGSGRPAGSIGALNHLFWSPDATKTSGVVGVWKEYADSTREQPTASPYEVAWWAVLLDSLLFAPLYALALGLFFLRATRQIAVWLEQGTPSVVKERLPKGNGAPTEEDHKTALRRYLWLAYLGLALAFFALVADEVENVANIRLVQEGWSAAPGEISDQFRSLTRLLWFAGWTKWILAGAAVLLAVALGWVITAEQSNLIRPRWASLRPRLHLLRLQIALVVAAVALPYGAEQLVDLIRRWTVAQLAGSLALAWLFAVATWLVGTRLLVAGVWQPTWRKPVRLRRILFATVLGLAAAQAAAHFLLPYDHKVGWGLLVPAATILVLAVFGLILPGSSPTDKARTADPALSAGDNRPGLPRALAAIAIVGFGLAIVHASFGYSVYERAWTRHPSALIALALVGACALLARLLARRPVVGGTPAARLVKGLLREPLVGMGVGSLLGLAVIQFGGGGGETPPEVLVGAGVLLIVGGWASYDTLGGDMMPKAKTTLLRAVLGLLAAILTVVYAAVVAWPFVLGERVGAVGILLFFLVVLACVGGFLVWVAPAIPVPLALSIAGFKRFPLVALLIFWFIVASHFDPGGYHDVRLRDASVGSQGVTLKEAWSCWLGKNGLDDASPCKRDSGSKPVTGSNATPLVFVATTGGGIRAAYWTDLVLDCAFEVQPGQKCPDGEHASDFGRSDRLFALSGISGGSVGLAEYAAYVSQKQADATKAKPGWVKSHLGVDALSASGAWWLMVELPRAFLRFDSPTDRAGILERGWERKWPGGELGQGLLAVSETDHMPLLLLNGTSVADGCRFSTSPLDANVETDSGASPGCRSTESFDPGESEGVSADSTLPATRELVDYLCGEKDVALSTAGLLSGRFPFVNPAGRIEGRCPPADTKAPVAYVVDGGYLDTSGTSPVLELMNGLQPLIDEWNAGSGNRCVAPVLIQIDNGFDAGRPKSSRPGELNVPLKTLFATRIGRAAEARIGGALHFRSGTPERWAHFVNVAHPGPKAPLGWTQSRASERELTTQLGQKKNEEAFKLVKSWLSGDLACPAGS